MVKPGFRAVYLSAKKLREFSYPFAVALEGQTVKAYLVTREVWHDIEKAYADNLIKEHISNQCPVIISTKDFYETAKQLEWIIVGEV